MNCKCGQKLETSFASRMGEPTYQSIKNTVWVCPPRICLSVIVKGKPQPAKGKAWSCLIYSHGSCAHAMRVSTAESGATPQEAEVKALDLARRICFATSTKKMIDNEYKQLSLW